MNNHKTTQIEECLSYGKYTEAIKLFEALEKERKITEEEILLKNYIQIFIYLDRGKFHKGCETADELLNLSKKYNNILKTIDAYIGRTENTICLDSFEESSYQVQKGMDYLLQIKDKESRDYKYRKAYLLFLQARIMQNSYKFSKAITLFEESYNIRKEINDQFGMLFTLINWGISITSNGDFKSGEDFLKKSLKIAKEIKNEVGIIWSLVYTGWIKCHLGELDEAISFAEKCLKICEVKNYYYAITNCYELLGNSYLNKGNLKDALYYFEENLELRLKMGYKKLVTQSYFSIGNVYSKKGELKRSLAYYNKILKTPETDEDLISKPTYLSTIGKIYSELGEFLIAKNYLMEAYDLLLKRNISVYHYLNFDISIAKTLHYLIILLVNHNEFKDLNFYLGELHKLSDDFPNLKQIRDLYRLDKAIILKSSTRLMDKMEAWTIFKGISEESVNDPEISIEAMTNLCELLIYEIEITGNKALIDEIEELSNKLLDIAKSQYRYNVMVETYFFKAKISLLNLDTDNARLLLTKAQNIAIDHGLKRLAKKISNEHDTLLAKLDEWELLTKKNIPLKERINYSRHEFLFSKMVRSKINNITNLKDIPVYFVILYSFDGRCLYSKAFEEISINDGNLISSFISAINLFGKEALSSSGSIDRIKHGEYLINIQPKERFLFAYAFKGQSYSAKIKLDNIIEKLSKSAEIFNVLNRSVENYLEIPEKTRLLIEDLVNEIILNA
ncbi:MAG: tetratricopeptide repeat protein [Candidatus Lokiarchaeota archaeon]|nr:tetratricopeptide repeat protein [Candidatus Lokiarchaeota archaeon]